MATTSLLDRVLDYIDRQQLLPPPATPGLTVVVGLSGGSDSVVLTHILHRAGYRLLLTHCHFGLRGAEADRDRDFCRRWAQSLGLPLHEVQFDTVEYARAHKVSIEMACRELRYGWWQEQFLSPQAPHRPAGGEVYLCVGHHADDSIETFLLNLLRGTGIRGLVGIPPKNGHIVRPLLCLTRHEIMAYIEAEGLQYVTDSTNLESHYRRNQIRNQLLPLMEQITPTARHAISQTMHHLNDAYRMAEVGLSVRLERYIHPFRRDGVSYLLLEREALNEVATEDAEHLIYCYTSRCASLPPAMLRDIARAMSTGEKNLTFRTDRAYLCLAAEGLYLTTDAAAWSEVEADPSTLPYFRLTTGSVHDFRPAENRDPEVAYLDADLLNLPLTARRWRTGDRIRPLGMTTGSKLVSDLFTNAHFSPIAKGWTWVITDAAGRIVWVSGLRLSDEVRVQSDTQRVLRIEHCHSV